jgi:hypothetical protein
VTAVTKLIDTSSSLSPPSLFSNPQPSSIKSKLKTVHNDNLASLLQINRSSHDFHLEMRVLDKQTNFAFTRLISTSDISHACRSITFGRTSIHLSQGLGSFDRLTDGSNSHEFCVDLNHRNWIAKPDFPAQIVIVDARQSMSCRAFHIIAISELLFRLISIANFAPQNHCSYNRLRPSR